MPYNRRYRGRRRKYQRKRGWMRKTGSALDTAAKALTVAYGVKRLLNVEKKFADTFISAASPSSTATIGSLFTIAQGDTVNTRDGYSLKPVSLTIDCTVYPHASAAASSTFRLMIGQMRSDANPVTITWFTGSMPNQLKNLDTAAYANILVDKLVQLDSTKPSRFYITLTDKQLRRMQYDDTDTTGTNYRNGQLFYYFQSNQATNTPTMNACFRLRYVDN